MTRSRGVSEGGGPYTWVVCALQWREQTDRCWDDWPFRITSRGRPTATPPMQQQGLASHLVLELQGLPRPSPAHGALHSCDNPPCLNPRHLRWGTQAENIADAVSRGRAPRAPGAKHWMAKLTDETIIEIRSRYAAGGVTQTALGAEYGVGQSSISRIVLHKGWSHV